MLLFLQRAEATRVRFKLHEKHPAPWKQDQPIRYARVPRAHELVRDASRLMNTCDKFSFNAAFSHVFLPVWKLVEADI